MDFSKRVLLTCCRIPEGRVATYGQIALLCGKPRAARQVGTVLGRKAEGYVPAHRVINSRGFLSGAAAFLGQGMQKALLEAEGVLVSMDGFVELDLFGWIPSQEELEALEKQYNRQGI